MQGNVSVVIALLLGIVGLGFVIWQIRNVLAEDTGNDTMREIAAAIQEGARAFLKREYMYLSVFVVVVAAAIAIFLDWQTAVCFIVGAITSAAAGYLGMSIAVRANVRTAAAASRSLNDGLRVAFSSGSVMGMAVVSFSIIGLSTLYLVFDGNILLPHRLWLWRQQHCALCPCRWRYLHQGGRCGRRPGGQGGAGHSRR